MNAICKADFDAQEKAHNAAVKAVEDAKKKGLSTKGIIVPEFSYHEIYGVWFFGKLKEIIQQVGTERFGVDLCKTMHVFIDVEPKKVADGVHDITVYTQQCRLYKWVAQGYHRGLVVLVDDGVGNMDAEVYRHSGTWSWVLPLEKK